MKAPDAGSPQGMGPSRLDRTDVCIGPGIELVTTRWDPRRHPARASDRTSSPVIEFMSSGSFRLRCRRGAGFGDANTAILFDADEEFSVEHPILAPNCGLSVRLAPDALASWWEPGVAVLERGRTLEIGLPGATHLAAVALRRRLLAGGVRDALELGSRLVALLDLLPVPHATAERAEAHARERVRRVRERIAASPDAPPSLAELARGVDCSPWHLAHEFKRWQGATIHAYARKLRLRAVLARLGTRPIGELAHDHGFSSHSHLTAAFRREFGLTPRCVSAALRSLDGHA